MRLITCAGYYGSGSSAITDLVAEYNTVFALSHYEFRFLQDMDGVRDLDYYLVQNHNRHNSGHAIKRFLKLSSFNAGTWFNKRYEPYFQNQYFSLTKKYVESLVSSKYYAHWFYDEYDKGRYYYYVKQLQEKVLKRLHSKKGILPNEITYCAHPSEEEFFSATKQYTRDLFSAANVENKPFVMVDQLLPPRGINRFLNYFDDIVVIVVDRDPRDVYYLAKNYWHEGIAPVDNVEVFCRWYRYVRESGSDEIDNTYSVLRIHFEDLIFFYEKTVEEIEQKTGLRSSDHIRRFEKMNPLKSVANTQTWKDKGCDEDIAIIEKELGEYLYPFELQMENDIVGIPVERKQIFWGE